MKENKALFLVILNKINLKVYNESNKLIVDDIFLMDIKDVKEYISHANPNVVKDLIEYI